MFDILILYDQTDYRLHEHILALWGMPLGEMLDLENLARTCREKGRWFFFFTSAPANVPGEFPFPCPLWCICQGKD